MKLSPLAEIKRDELAEEYGNSLDHVIDTAMPTYDFKEGFSEGYAFANEEKNERAEKLLRIRLEHDFDLFWHTTLGKLITEALAEYRQGSKE